mmetsp:Transcript_24309/g.61634  ORF Transcript_24309/g.61634 Transcript_24309/m.61634 type:complete len:276 (-) Transcript_24309:1431-2258(-)
MYTPQDQLQQLPPNSKHWSASLHRRGRLDLRRRMASEAIWRQLACEHVPAHPVHAGLDTFDVVVRGADAVADALPRHEDAVGEGLAHELRVGMRRCQIVKRVDDQRRYAGAEAEHAWRRICWPRLEPEAGLRVREVNLEGLVVARKPVVRVHCSRHSEAACVIRCTHCPRCEAVVGGVEGAEHDGPTIVVVIPGSDGDVRAVIVPALVCAKFIQELEGCFFDLCQDVAAQVDNHDHGSRPHLCRRAGQVGQIVVEHLGCQRENVPGPSSSRVHGR